MKLNYAGPTPLLLNLMESFTLMPPSSLNYILTVVLETSNLTDSTLATTMISNECLSFKIYLNVYFN